MQHEPAIPQIDRGFVRISEGQVHYREASALTQSASIDERPPLWMLHASPASSVSLVGLIGELGRTRRVLAPDTLGNGDSAPPAVAAPDAAYYAGASLRAMTALGIDRVDLYGSHTGAHIAVEMAILAPERVRRIVLDGIGMFSPEDKVEFLANYAPAKQPDFFGSQFHWAWHFVRDQAWFFPYFKRDAAHLRGLDAPSADVLHMITLEVLKGLRTYHLAYRAAFSHDDAGRLPLVKQRTLAMADSSDPLKAGVDRAAALLPDATKLILDADYSADGQRRKASVIRAFLDNG
jgi:pimeloyl-ACP methyl ester carboxylesterase